jgi:hypothetical protein
MVLALLNAPGEKSGMLLSYVLVTLVEALFATAGALIVSRAGGNPIGWVMIGMGLSLALGALSEQYVLRGYVLAPGSLPFLSAMGWFTVWTGQAAIVFLPIVFLIFPTGRPPSPRWRWVLRLGVSAAVVGVVAAMLSPALEDGITNALKDHGLRLVNPVGVERVEGVLSAALSVAGLVGAVTAILGIVSLVLRTRRAKAEERQQIKWLAVVGVGILAVFVLMLARPLYVAGDSVWSEVLWFALVTLVFVGIPAAVTTAVLKYRLYDIDLVINKTLVYGALTGALAILYGLMVLGLGALARSLGGNSDSPLVVAASTLTAAALFRPLRHRVQSFIDRRFYRRRYDTRRALEAFASTLRDQVDLDELSSRLLNVVDGTIQPRQASLWLRMEVAT